MATHPPERFDLDGLVLRRSTLDDAEVTAATVAANLEHLRPWMPWAGPEAATVEVQRERLVVQDAAWADGSEHFYLAVDPEGRRLGAFGMHRRIGPGGMELGYWLCADAVGKGYATTAVRALTTAALELDDIEHVEIRCDEANVRSAAVPRRLGYRLDRVEPDEVSAPAEIGRSMIWVFPPA